jgi:hypothetical protein
MNDKGTEDEAALWRETVERHLRDVLDSQAMRYESQSHTNWGETVRYANATTGLIVARSIEFNRSEVSLVRLVNDGFPPYPIFVGTTPVLHQFLLDNLIALRAPELVPQLRLLTGLTHEEVAVQLERYAAWLNTYAADVMSGDFTVFADLEAVVRQRVADSPESIQVWLPEDAPADAEASERRRLESATPSIPVVFKRYRR